MPHDGELSQEDANSLTQAASSLFFAVLLEEASEHNCSIVLPWLLTPPAPLPAPASLSPTERKEAMDFLIRLGIIQQDADGRARVPLQLNA
jgi:hypothetical protein